jgi:hypothetical protein
MCPLCFSTLGWIALGGGTGGGALAGLVLAVRRSGKPKEEDDE